MQPGSGVVRRWSCWHRCLHGLTVLSFVVLGVTGLVSAIALGGLQGWWLLAHMLAAPVYAVSLTTMVVMWADSCRFVRHDADWLRRAGGFLGRRDILPADKFDAGQKMFFWIVTILGFLALASMMASMTSIFGQGATVVLHAIHRYSALGLVVVVILHTYVTGFAKPGTLWAMLSGRVSIDWARQYHPLWLERLESESERNHEK